jgi:hypothetical protein
MPELPRGTVTCRSTDIQSSTPLLQLAICLQATLPSSHPLCRPPASDCQHSRKPLDAERHHGDSEDAAVHAEVRTPLHPMRLGTRGGVVHTSDRQASRTPLHPMRLGTRGFSQATGSILRRSTRKL